LSAVSIAEIKVDRHRLANDQTVIIEDGNVAVWVDAIDGFTIRRAGPRPNRDVVIGQTKFLQCQ
jgi:hypothetical protein